MHNTAICHHFIPIKAKKSEITRLAQSGFLGTRANSGQNQKPCTLQIWRIRPIKILSNQFTSALQMVPGFCDAAGISAVRQQRVYTQ